MKEHFKLELITIIKCNIRELLDPFWEKETQPVVTKRLYEEIIELIEKYGLN